MALAGIFLTSDSRFRSGVDWALTRSPWSFLAIPQLRVFPGNKSSWDLRRFLRKGTDVCSWDLAAPGRPQDSAENALSGGLAQRGFRTRRADCIVLCFKARSAILTFKGDCTTQR